MEERLRFRVTGRVQGVFFRACTRDAAWKIGVTGWVRNSPDGSVEGEAAGKTEALNAFIEWLRRGSSHSRVERVEIVDRREEKSPFRSFEIRY